jgi:hypothetical protein
MFYRAWMHTPNPQKELVYLSDSRTPAEMGTALVGDGFLVSKAGEVAWVGYNDGQVTANAFNFKGTGQVVLFAQHLIRLEEHVLAPGTSVTET